VGRVQFGLIVPENPENPPGRSGYLADIDRLLAAAAGHYDSAWCIDHLQGDVLEGWTTVSYLSALHPDLRWGHTVLCQTFRNPALLAKMIATLQCLSGGRTILGIGAGGQESEYQAYGYDFPPGRTRVAELGEALRIIKALWTEERSTFLGKHYRIENALCEPKPDPRPPIMIGAFRPQMLRLTARHADWWNVSSTAIDDYRTLVGEFERACAAVGRDPATVRRTTGGGCVCAPSEAEVAALVAQRQRDGQDFAYDPGDFVGTPAQLLAQMRPFIDLGVDYFMLDCGGFPDLTTVETLVREVMPAINR
jgi:alkanesulfonate monooxygenase SsuD/methylene tetrahydromethanopterin reductase-like flavin-dependent oxidoreductase (luciferase family)